MKIKSEIKKDLKVIDSFVNFVIIRNYEFLFSTNPIEKDIDLFSKELTNNQKNKIEALGYTKVSDKKYRTTFVKFFPKQKKLFFLDFHKRTLTGNPLSYNLEKNLLKDKVSKSGIPILTTEKYFSTLLLRELLSEGFKEKYRERLVELFDVSSKKKLAKLLSTVLRKKEIVCIAKCMQKRDFTTLEKLRRKIKLRFILKNQLKYFAAALYLSKRSKKIVAFIGMDGSGKSTVLETCLKILKMNDIPVKSVYMGRGKKNILPVQKPAKLVKDHTRSIPRIIVTSIYSLAAFVYAFDFLLRSLKLLRSHSIILCDRFSSDILLMPKVPKVLKKLLYNLLPKADRYIYLYSDIKTLQKRKGHNKQDLLRQQKNFEWINKTLNSVIIKNTTLTHTIDLTLRAILRS